MREDNISLSKKKRRPRRSRKSFLRRYPDVCGGLFALAVWLILVIVSFSRYTVSFLWLGLLTALVFAVWAGINLYLGRIGASKDGSNSWLGCLLGPVLFAVVGWGAMAALTMMNRSSYLINTGLGDKADDFAKSAQKQKEMPPAIQGKVVILENTNGKHYSFGEMQLELPSELLPESVEEVSTVVLVRLTKTAVTEYTSRKFGTKTGGKGYQWSATATLVNYQTKTAFHTKKFFGSHPGPGGRHGIDQVGSMPNSQVVHWIKNLPRQ